MEKIRTKKFARIIGWLFHPFWVAPLAFALIIYLDGNNLPGAIGWALLSLLLLTGPVLIFLLRKLSKKQLTDFDVSHREQRAGVFVFGTSSIFAGFLALWKLGAPDVTLHMLVATLITLPIFALVTKFITKISIHSGAMAGVTVVVAFYSWAWAFVWLGFTLLVMWSRVVIKRHTLSQVISGAGVAGCIFFATMLARN